MGDRRDAYRVLVGRPEGKGSLGRPKLRWDDSIKMDLQQVGLERQGPDCSGSGWGQVLGACECGNEPSAYIKCGEFLYLLKTFWLLRKESAAWS
jgi:hypothetical protein